MNISQFFSNISVNLIDQLNNIHGTFLYNIIKTLLLLVLLFAIRAATIWYLNRIQNLSLESKRTLIVNTRNITLSFFVIGIFFIWGSQIKDYALSMAAVAVAITMSFKEMITNFMGGVGRTISHPFNIGDRIKVGNFRGDVIDANMLTTTILEVGPGDHTHQYTGSSISIPNSLLLNTPALNESFMREYVLHVFHVLVKREGEWLKHQKYLLDASNIVCAPYINKARNYLEASLRKISVEPPTADPRVLLLFNKAEEVDFVVRVASPARRTGSIEQEILTRYSEMVMAEYKQNEKDYKDQKLEQKNMEKNEDK